MAAPLSALQMKASNACKIQVEQIQIRLLERTSGPFQDRFGFCHLFYPSGSAATPRQGGKAGGLHLRRCRGLAVADYGCALGALALKLFGFCNIGDSFAFYASPASVDLRPWNPRSSALYFGFNPSDPILFIHNSNRGNRVFSRSV
jgi:hypothetical protein